MRLDKLMHSMIWATIGGVVVLVGGIVIFVSVITDSCFELGTWILISGICSIVASDIVIDIVMYIKRTHRIKKR